MRKLLALVALTSLLIPAASLPAQAGPHEWHICPTDARGTVSHNGDASWVATTQSSGLVDTRVAPIGGVVALICVYRMFGSEYWIYKHPSPDFVNCRPDVEPGGRRGFFCGRI